MNQPYEGVSMMVMSFETQSESIPWPSPIIFYDQNLAQDMLPIDGIKVEPFRVFDKSDYKEKYKCYFNKMPDFGRMHNPKQAGAAADENESVSEITGNGHHGPDCVGVASVRAGKGMRAAPSTSIVPITVL